MMVRSESEKEKFARMGLARDRLTVTGNCKIDALVERKRNLSPSARGLFSGFGGHENAPLFLAGSTWSGENETVRDAFEQILERYPRARLVVAPRFMRDIPEAVQVFQSRKMLRLSDFDDPETTAAPKKNWDVLIVDKIGILFELYAMADAAFVGGSLVPRGGHNLMEPSIFGVPTAHGPHMVDFPESVEMDQLGISRTVRDADELARAWLDALDPDYRVRCQAAGSAWFETVGGAIRKSWEILINDLSELRYRISGDSSKK